jgi:hypothetical protein
MTDALKYSTESRSRMYSGLGGSAYGTVGKQAQKCSRCPFASWILSFALGHVSRNTGHWVSTVSLPGGLLAKDFLIGFLLIFLFDTLRDLPHIVHIFRFHLLFEPLPLLVSTRGIVFVTHQNEL